MGCHGAVGSGDGGRGGGAAKAQAGGGARLTGAVREARGEAQVPGSSPTAGEREGEDKA